MSRPEPSAANPRIARKNAARPMGDSVYYVFLTGFGVTSLGL